MTVVARRVDDDEGIACNPCSCWNLIDGATTAGIWTLVYAISQIALFGWQTSAISVYGDRFPGRQDLQYQRPEELFYTALFFVQIVHLVTDCFLVGASVALIWGLHYRSRYLLWPWFPSLLSNILVTTAWCLIWWIRGVESYWTLLTVAEMLTVLTNIYCFFTGIAGYRYIKRHPDPNPRSVYLLQDQQQLANSKTDSADDKPPIVCIDQHHTNQQAAQMKTVKDLLRETRDPDELQSGIINQGYEASPITPGIRRPLDPGVNQYLGQPQLYQQQPDHPYLRHNSAPAGPLQQPSMLIHATNPEVIHLADIGSSRRQQRRSRENRARDSQRRSRITPSESTASLASHRHHRCRSSSTHSRQGRRRSRRHPSSDEDYSDSEFTATTAVSSRRSGSRGTQSGYRGGGSRKDSDAELSDTGYSGITPSDDYFSDRRSRGSKGSRRRYRSDRSINRSMADDDGTGSNFSRSDNVGAAGRRRRRRHSYSSQRRPSRSAEMQEPAHEGSHGNAQAQEPVQQAPGVQPLNTSASNAPLSYSNTASHNPQSITIPQKIVIPTQAITIPSGDDADNQQPGKPKKFNINSEITIRYQKGTNQPEIIHSEPGKPPPSPTTLISSTTEATAKATHTYSTQLPSHGDTSSFDKPPSFPTIPTTNTTSGAQAYSSTAV